VYLLEPLTHIAYIQGMDISQNINKHWCHRLYLVIQYPLGVISLLGYPFCAFKAVQLKHEMNDVMEMFGYPLLDNPLLPNQAINSYVSEISNYTAWSYFFLFAWFAVYVLYRAILFVAFGKEVFVKKQSH
jgi:hypothetical protein